MARTITALFDTRADAEAGAERLRQAGVDAGNVSVHDDAGQTGNVTGGAGDKGMWASIKHALLPAQDRQAYEEGVRRGGFLLTADVDDEKTPAAVRALEDANSVDLDARSAEWRSSGWDFDDSADAALDDGVYPGTRDTAVGSTRYRAYRRDES